MLTVSFLERYWNFADGQVYQLINAGFLKAVSEHRSGPGGSARVDKGSVVTLLKERRIPLPVSD